MKCVGVVRSKSGCLWSESSNRYVCDAIQGGGVSVDLRETLVNSHESRPALGVVNATIKTIFREGRRREYHHI